MCRRRGGNGFHFPRSVNKHFPCEILLSVNKLYQAQQDADFVNYGLHKSEKRKKKCVLANKLWLSTGMQCSQNQTDALFTYGYKKGKREECWDFLQSSTWMQLKLVSVMTIYTQVCKIEV